MSRDFKANPECGPITALRYERVGLRILPILPDSKEPRVGGFGKKAPDFSCPAEDFRDDDCIAILCGPCPAGATREPSAPRWLICLDLDGAFSKADLITALGPLPETLTSKGERHFWFWVPDSPQRAALKQRPKTAKIDGGALDVKWCGGYALERGDWDCPFDIARIAQLPQDALDRLVSLQAKASSDGAPVRSEVISALAKVWARAPEAGGNGGRYESALALGGVLAKSDWSEDQIADFASALFEAADVDDRTEQVLASVANFRAGEKSVFGWPKLREHMVGSKQAIGRACNALSRYAGLDKVESKLERAKAGFAEGDPRREVITASEVEIARLICARHLPGAVFDGGLFVPNSSNVYELVPDARVASWVREYDGAAYTASINDKGGTTSWLRMSDRFIRGVISQVESMCTPLRPFFVEAPAGIAFRNGFLCIADGSLAPIVREHRVKRVLPFDYDPAPTPAQCAHWLAFLESLWGDVDGGGECVVLLHQWLGYILAGRVDLQKIMLMSGPARAGKGTILQILDALLGDVCVPFKVSNLDGPFCLAHMAHARVAHDGDVRRPQGVQKNEGAIVEKLLSISGRDAQTVARKFKDNLNIRLNVQFILATNPGGFALRDPSGVLSSRLSVLPFVRSFAANPDTELLGRLKTELPAIVALAVQALAAMGSCGFVEPALASPALAELKAAEEPLRAFLEDCCARPGEAPSEGQWAPPPESRPAVACNELVRAYREWIEETGRNGLNTTGLRAGLRALGIERGQSKIDGKPRWEYRGLWLRPREFRTFH